MSAPPGVSSPAARAQPLQWQRLGLIRARFIANVAALAEGDAVLAGALRDHLPAAEYVLAFRDNQIILATLVGTTATVLPARLSAAAAQETLGKVYATGRCTEPVLIAGIDQGWLWHFAYYLQTSVAALPGHRPPLYFLVHDLEELWLALHLHDWRALLVDARVRLFCGADAAVQFQNSLAQNLNIPWPRISLTLDPRLWGSSGVTSKAAELDGILAPVQQKLFARLEEIRAGYARDYAWATGAAVAEKLRTHAPLNILGITSRYTTFLQYSMRDWLAAATRLGHNTRLLIEDADHQILTPMQFASACAEFQPDIIFLIDHYRTEFAGVLPDQVPCVMWVQDRLPNIFSDAGGQAQGARDFCLGFGRLHLTQKHQYPAARYMPSTMGVNENRFRAADITDSDLAAHVCDVSFVSHASTPADELLSVQLAQSPPDQQKLFRDVYDRLVAWYADGGAAISEISLRILIEQSIAGLHMNVTSDLKPLVVFFNQQINNALFRHQTLLWLAESGVDLHLYGRGWEKHPKLGRFARGVAANDRQLALIYQASRINLQVTPHGVVHQRLLDGLAAGGFFLLRWHPGDCVGRIYQELLHWCQRNQITSDEQIYARADDQIRTWIASLNDLEGSPAARRELSIYDVMLGHQESGFMASADSIWSQYEDVAFTNKADLQSKLRHFLANADQRRQIAHAMRQKVIDRVSYASITKRLLEFVATGLA